MYKKSHKKSEKLFNSKLLLIFIQVLIEQERAVINQRRMYEGNIADLEKALYDKTKEAEAAVNSAENMEWRNTVKRMLQHDIEANSRLSNKLNKAMELVSTLEVIIWWTYRGECPPPSRDQHFLEFMWIFFWEF